MMQKAKDFYVVVEYDDVADYLQEASHNGCRAGRRHKKV